MDFSAKKRYRKSAYLSLTEKRGEEEQIFSIKDYINSKNSGKNVLFRHDVDHDIEEALRMARWEINNGFTSTYCILHSAWYYGELKKKKYHHSQLLKDSIADLVAMGHEINLHNNVISESLRQGINPRETIFREIDFLRSLGADVVGTSTHGDKLCNQFNFRNFEIFEEIAAVFSLDNQRPPNAELCDSIGCVSMEELGLSYEAYGFSPSVYISDSGGGLRCHLGQVGWSSCVDSLSLSYNPKIERYVLTHPVWWDFR